MSSKDGGSDCICDEGPEMGIGQVYCIYHMRPHYYCLQSQLSTEQERGERLSAAISEWLDFVRCAGDWDHSTSEDRWCLGKNSSKEFDRLTDQLDAALAPPPSEESRGGR